MKDKIKKMLAERRVDVFLGYSLVEGHCLPHFFTADRLEELEGLVTGPTRYPLEKMVLVKARQNPAARIGLLARDCNQRTLKVLFEANQLDPGQVETIDLNCCPSSLKDKADCSYLKPIESGPVKKEIGVNNRMELSDLESLPSKERLGRWLYEFDKCIKCYGCRDICPVCYCRECSLEHPELVTPGRLPVETPLFHLVRAVHMAGRCTDCGLCEEACPMDIPLRLLYGKVNEIMDRVFDYRPGSSLEKSPFSTLDMEKHQEPDLNNMSDYTQGSIKMSDRLVPSVCSYCGTGCGILFQVVDEKLAATWPLKTHPVNEGKLCLKGWNLHEFVNSFMRLKTPLVRIDGHFKKATWDKAIEYMAERLGEVIEKYGPDSVGVLASAKATNEENFLAQKFARTVIGTNNVDHCARL